MGQYLSLPNLRAFLDVDSIYDAPVFEGQVNRLSLLKRARIGVADDATRGIDVQDADWDDPLLLVASNQSLLELARLRVGATAEKQWYEDQE